MSNRALRRTFRWVFGLTVLALAVSGVGQMPIFKRYYIADIPGLAWTADFYVTHLIHYLAATVFLLLLGFRAGGWLVERASLSRLQWLQAAALAGVILTGALRVWKNLPDAHLSMAAGMAVDISHMVFALAWGGLALAAVLSGRRGQPSSP